MTEQLLDATLNLFAAFLLSGFIGFERQWRQRLAGLRTNTLVALGAASFVIFSQQIPGDASPTRVAAQIVSGIGFLGAGIIFKEGLNVRGLNTAATLWCSAAIGTMCGAGLYPFAAVSTAFIIIVNLLLRPLVRVIHLQPFGNTELEIHYSIRIVCHADAEAHVRSLLLRDLGNDLYILGIESIDIEGTDRVEVSALIKSGQRQDRAVEQIIGLLSLEPRVTSARWSLEIL